MTPPVTGWLRFCIIRTDSYLNVTGTTTDDLHKKGAPLVNYFIYATYPVARKRQGDRTCTHVKYYSDVFKSECDARRYRMSRVKIKL